MKNLIGKILFGLALIVVVGAIYQSLSAWPFAWIYLMAAIYFTLYIPNRIGTNEWVIIYIIWLGNMVILHINHQASLVIGALVLIYTFSKMDILRQLIKGKQKITVS